ncbi:MAG TPA: PAS domain S-box protein [Gemmata sp.]|jgi:PAS domain S-box-containing protein|nr:PAS domain S-box protein [Gemmata sp.]
MQEEDNEEKLLRSVALQNAQSILLARQRAEQELIQTKEALRKQSEWLRVTLASIGDGTIATDAEGRVTFMNGVAESLTGWSQAQAIGQLLSDVFRIVNEYTRQTTENPTLRALQEGIIVGQANHTILIAKYGTERPIDNSAAPIRDESGAIVGAVLVFRDVTNRRRTETVLRESEARYRAIVEATPECVKLVGPDGTLLQMNQAGLAMVEADEAGTVLGQCVYNLVAPEYLDQFRAFNEQVCRGEGGTLEFDIIGLKGTRRHMETTAVPLAAPDGGFSHLAVTRDVTERVKASRALTESRARLDYAVRVSGIGFWYSDLPFDELIWDERVREHFWVPPGERVTIDLFYNRLHPDDRDRTRQAVERAIRERVPYEIDYRTVDPATGEIKWVRARGATAYGPSSDPVRFDGVTMDVTVHKKAEESLREADRKKDEFIALLAHELRNPLAPIRNGLQVVRLAGGNPDIIARARTMMERQLSHMVRLVDDLLDVSRISRNKMELQRGHVLLADVVMNAIETARPLIDAEGHELVVSLPQRPISLYADVTRLAQVFSNLLVNSAKYTPPGGRIWLSAKQDDRAVTVSVRDTGIGIPSVFLENIFDMFSQVDRSIERRNGGLGIGLALVKGLVEMHGGTVSATSEGEGKGSTFTIKLPMLMETSDSALDVVFDNGQAATGPRRRILVADDNLDGAESMAEMLRCVGDEVWTANDGLEAVAATEAFRPEIILMDIGMPRLNGLDATRRIREQPWGKVVAIIALTGWGQDGDRERSREAGCDGHLVKPVNLTDLEKMLAEVLRQRV